MPDIETAGEDRKRAIRVPGDDLPDVDESDLLTISEVCDRLRISFATFRRILARGEGPTLVMVGKRVRVRRATLRAWIANSERAAAAESKAA